MINTFLSELNEILIIDYIFVANMNLRKKKYLLAVDFWLQLICYFPFHCKRSSTGFSGPFYLDAIVPTLVQYDQDALAMSPPV